MAYYKLYTVDLFGYLHTSKDMISGKNGFENMIKNEYEHYTQFSGPCVGSSENQTCLMPISIFFYGIGDGELACIVFSK